MQEKVSSIPPQIKIIEGKPPPTSWVNDNIVQYLQTQSQVSFLTDLLSYVQSLQAQQLVQARTRLAEIKESFISIPEQGSGEEIANASLFNDTQSLVKIEMESLQKIMTLLTQGNPKLAHSFNSWMGQLNQIIQSFPHLSPQQMQSLTQIWQNLQNLLKELPQQHQRTFWNSQLFMLQSLMAECKENIQDSQHEVQELQARNQLLSQMNQWLSEIQKILKSSTLTSTQLQDLISHLQNLANSLGKSNPQQQQTLTAFFQELNRCKTANQQPLNQLLADTIIHNRIEILLKSNPQMTPSQVKEHIRNFLKESNLQASPLAFMQTLGESIEDVLDKKGFPETSGYCGESFLQVKGERLSVNSKFLDHLLATYSPDPESARGLEKKASSLSQAGNQEMEENLSKIKGLTTNAKELQKIQDHFGKSSAHALIQTMAAGTPPPSKDMVGAAAPSATTQSLPSQFVNIILGHYMPGQEAYLEALAMMLSIANMGAGFGNTLLGILSDFQSAATNYDFNQNLHPSDQPPNFSGSYTKAKQQFANEQQQVNNDIAHTKSALANIQSQLTQIQNKINAQPPPPPDQLQALQQMQTKLQGIQTNLTAALSQLTTLQTTLGTITINPPTGNPPPSSSNYFSVSSTDSNWQSDLGTDENMVINGTTQDGTTVGGLLNIGSTVTAFQQNYSNQSQNQQMMLQMRMTEIQQEWTVVSTALQMLNQMYMTVCQAIYK